MDNEFIEIVSFVLSILALLSIFSILTVKLFCKIRSYFPISVNCWFCNCWTRVPYANQNSFNCPHCTQYNGFTEDGGYNKVIEEQHKFTKSSPGKLLTRSNGLCISCNHNQQLKITQLAKFTPLIEDNYDEEIEHFKKQLEKAYKLCKPCRHVLKNTLLKEKAAFLGNHVFNIQKKGKNIYEKVFKKSEEGNGSYLLKIFKKVQGILAIIVILKTTSDVLNGQQPERFPDCLLPYLELYQDISKTLSLILHHQFTMFNMQLLCSFGFFMQIIPLTIESTLICVKINQILCWSFLALVAWTKLTDVHMKMFQIACASLIFYNSFYEFKTIASNKQMKKLPRSCDNSLDEDCSDEEVDDITSQYNELLFTKTKTDKHTAKNTINRIPKESILCSSIRSSLEDLHLSKSTFKMEKSDMSFCSRSSSPRSRQGVISPSKLNYFENQNSWVAGGFWMGDDGSIEPAEKSLTESQSSGFCSQADVRLNEVFNGHQFNSLPTSIHHSLSGDFDRMSLAPKPYFSLNSSPPQSGMMNFSCVSPNNSFIYQPTYSFGNNSLYSPASTPRPVFSQPKPSLFKFSPVSQKSECNFNQKIFSPVSPRSECNFNQKMF